MSGLRSFLLAFYIVLFLSASSSQPPPTGDNILLIIVDTLRADHLACYGGRRGVSPVVDRLAEEGVQFMHAHTTAPWTQPAVASLLTSLYPSKHGVVNIADVLSAKHITLSEELKKHGYTTAGVVSHELISSQYGFAQGFDYFNQENAKDHEAVTSLGVTYEAIRWMKQYGGEKFFLMVHYFDPHAVYHHHPEFNYIQQYAGNLKPGEPIWDLRDKRSQMTESDIRFLTDLYDEEVRYTDKHIGVLMNYLEQAGLRDKTLIVFTADHGEEFLTHGWIGHTRTLYQELVHVPLIINHPKRFKPKRVRANVSTLDIVPTLFESMKIPYEASAFDGVSLVRYLENDAPQDSDRPIFFEVSFGLNGRESTSHVARKKQKVAFKQGIIQDGWKLIHDTQYDQWEMYNTVNDPVETKNLATKQPAIRKRLESSLKEWSAELDHHRFQSEEAIPPSKAERERLKALGYIQ